ncbi:centaurin alpha [Reticulomyxa filosa]|uniref:Centaurin alpha n=1 Tax=Reticulomyxa filosa TaxID=46433 RepID=X6P546_RETFI|nr:centaurin alpha [Reticulomyxa filosa]|eukprot:ETO32712.1 centaurin alpha [Reticulomyxa filosa]
MSALHGNIAHTAKDEQCIECDSTDVEWASLNLGVFLCEKCSGRHRALGTHVSQVRSLWLDSKAWTPDVIQVMGCKGNQLAKQYYEAKVPTFVVKPPEDQGPMVMEKWLILKYQRKLFVDHDSNHIYNTSKNDQSKEEKTNVTSVQTSSSKMQKKKKKKL